MAVIWLRAFDIPYSTRDDRVGMSLVRFQETLRSPRNISYKRVEKNEMNPSPPKTPSPRFDFGGYRYFYPLAFNLPQILDHRDSFSFFPSFFISRSLSFILFFCVFGFFSCNIHFSLSPFTLFETLVDGE